MLNDKERTRRGETIKHSVSVCFADMFPGQSLPVLSQARKSFAIDAFLQKGSSSSKKLCWCATVMIGDSLSAAARSKNSVCKRSLHLAKPQLQTYTQSVKHRTKDE